MFLARAVPGLLPQASTDQRLRNKGSVAGEEKVRDVPQTWDCFNY